MIIIIITTSEDNVRTSCKSIERERGGEEHMLEGILLIWIKHHCHLFLMITKPNARKGLRKCG